MLSFCLHGSSSCSVLWSDRVKYYPLILYFKWKLFEVLFQSDQWLKTNVKFWLLWYAFDKQTFDKWEWLFKVHYARVFNKSFWNRYLLESSLWILKSFLLNEKYVTLNKKKLKCRSKIFAHNLKKYDISTGAKMSKSMPWISIEIIKFFFIFISLYSSSLFKLNIIFASAHHNELDESTLV